MRITLFGTGYVGLVTGACLAEVGHQVVCIDVDAAKVECLRRGEVPIFEPGLEPLVRNGMAAGRLRFETEAELGVAHAEVIMIAVGTPPEEDGSADLRHVLAVARSIGRHLARPAVVVNKSTVPVGTVDLVTATISAALAERGVEIAFDVVSNPEFLKEGDAVKDCMRPDRIVLGSRNARAIETLRRMYAPFNRNRERIVVMDARSAELTKYAANAMLATKISFMNEMAGLAERVGADIEMVRHGIGSDTRIGYHFIYPGAGYGGSCFPKDVKALGRVARQHGFTPALLDAVDAVNQRQKQRLFDLLHAHFDGALSDRVIAVWGLAFKPNTDDMREAPSRTLLELLWRAGAQVRAHDPQAMDVARAIYGERSDLTLCRDPMEAVQGASALVVVTEWKAYWNPDFAAIREALSDAALFDGRNIYFPDQVEEAGLAYYGIGRGRSLGLRQAAWSAAQASHLEQRRIA